MRTETLEGKKKETQKQLYLKNRRRKANAVQFPELSRHRHCTLEIKISTQKQSQACTGVEDMVLAVHPQRPWDSPILHRLLLLGFYTIRPDSSTHPKIEGTRF